MSRPFAYLRKSSVRDLAKEISPETQEREVRVLAARNGDDGDALAMLSDWDISGRAKFTAKRAGYLRLVDAVQSGEASAVYSYSLSRLGRSVAELSRFFDLCAERHVPVRLVVDSVDTSTASGRLLANVLGSVAQFEAEVAGERLKAMYETKRARAREQGTSPVDAVRTSRRYGEADGEDASVVLEVFRETGSYSKAARRLNEMGIKPRSSDKWWASSVGVVVERLDPEVAARPKAQGHPRGGTDFTLAKLLRCPMDGATLTGSRIPDKKGKRWTRYACRHAEAVPHPRVSIAQHLILPAIEQEAARYWNPDEDDPGPGVTERRRKELIARRERVVESRLDGLIDRSEAAQRVAEIDAELNRLVKPPKPDLRLPRQRTPKEQNAILRLLFERIELDPQTFQPVGFVWRNPEWREPDRAS
jgi:DNA invertase Pin-like site-specific DNA recombinase